MSRTLTWLLAGALASAAITWWNDHQPTPDVVEVSRTSSDTGGSAAIGTGSGSHEGTKFDHSRQRWAIERDPWPLASTDPFVLDRPAPPPPPPPAPPLPAPAPTPPTFPYRYFGRMTSPAGEEAIYLTQADQLVPIVAGQTLEGGFQITSIDAAQIIVTFAPLGTQTVIPIPSSDQGAL